MSLIEAYNKHTGEKLPHLVPEKWVGHPVFGPSLSKTPRQKAAEKPAEAPDAGETAKEK